MWDKKTASGNRTILLISSLSRLKRLGAPLPSIVLVRPADAPSLVHPGPVRSQTKI